MIQPFEENIFSIFPALNHCLNPLIEDTGYMDTKYRGDYCLSPLIVDTWIPNIEEIIV